VASTLQPGRLTRSSLRPLPLLGAAALVALIGVTFRPGRPPSVLAVMRASQPRLLLHRFVAGQIEPLAEGAEVRAGDLVQASYLAAGRSHGVVLSLDGRGRVTLHFPDRPRDSTRLEPSRETPLGHAFELDDAPAFERFVFITAPEPIDTARVLTAAQALAREPDAAPGGRLALPAGLGQTSVLLRKMVR
jgi:hypothetical protein